MSNPAANNNPVRKFSFTMEACLQDGEMPVVLNGSVRELGIFAALACRGMDCLTRTLAEQIRSGGGEQEFMEFTAGLNQGRSLPIADQGAALHPDGRAAAHGEPGRDDVHRHRR